MTEPEPMSRSSIGLGAALLWSAGFFTGMLTGLVVAAVLFHV